MNTLQEILTAIDETILSDEDAQKIVQQALSSTQLVAKIWAPEDLIPHLEKYPESLQGSIRNEVLRGLSWTSLRDYTEADDEMVRYIVDSVAEYLGIEKEA